MHRRLSAQLPRGEWDCLLSALTKFWFSVECDRGWNYAEVTAGGVLLEETNFRTMESKALPGLYLTGETLECDGRISGMSFQWAWATGWIAGCAGAKRVRADSEARR